MSRLTCERVGHWLVDREDARPADVTRHLESCPGCRAEAAYPTPATADCVS